MKETEQYVSGEQFKAMKNHQKSKKISNYQRPLLAIAGLLIVAGISFYGGTQYQKDHTKSSVATTQSRTGSGGFFSRFGGQRPSFGQVTAVSATSITVDLQSGTSTTYSITSSTTITDNGQTTTVSDIQTGDTVAVVPSTTDSSQASRILVNPSFGGGGGSPQSTGGTSD